MASVLSSVPFDPNKRDATNWRGRMVKLSEAVTAEIHNALAGNATELTTVAGSPTIIRAAPGAGIPGAAGADIPQSVGSRAVESPTLPLTAGGVVASSPSSSSSLLDLTTLSPQSKASYLSTLNQVGQSLWALCVLDDREKGILHVRLNVSRISEAHSIPSSPVSRSQRSSPENSPMRGAANKVQNENSPSEGGSKPAAKAVRKSKLKVMHKDLRNTNYVATRQDVMIQRKDILKSSFTAIGVPIKTTLGIGVLTGYRPRDDIHIIRYPLFSATAYLQRDCLLQEVHVCPELPVHTPYGLGTAAYYNKEYGTWTIKMSTPNETFAESYLTEDRIRCDSRFVPLVEAGKRKWKRKQLKTFALLEKLQKLAVETGVVEKMQETYQDTKVTEIVKTTKKAWNAAADVVEKQTQEIVHIADEVGTMLETADSPEREKEKADKNGKDSSSASGSADDDDVGFLSAGESDDDTAMLAAKIAGVGGSKELTPIETMVSAGAGGVTAPVKTTGFVVGGTTLNDDDVVSPDQINLEDPNSQDPKSTAKRQKASNLSKSPESTIDSSRSKDGGGDDGFVDVQAGDEELVKMKEMAEKQAYKIQTDVEQKLKETNIVAEAEELAEHLKQQGEKVGTTLVDFGGKAVEVLAEEEEVKKALDYVEQARHTAEEKLKKGEEIYEKSRMADVVNHSKKKLEEKLERIRQKVGDGSQSGGGSINPDQEGIHGAAGQGQGGKTGTTAVVLQENLSKMADQFAQNQVWQTKGAALFGTVQRRYLAGPDGWIAKTRKKLTQVLQDDALGLSEWDFSTYTNSVLVEQKLTEKLTEASSIVEKEALEVVDLATTSTKARGKYAKKAVNSAAEQLLQYAKPEESAMELLVKLDSMQGIELLDTLDLQGILEKAGITVPPQISKYFIEDDNLVVDAERGSANATKNIFNVLSNTSGENVLTKVLDDDALVAQTEKMVGQLENALDKVSDLAQNKTVQSLLQQSGMFQNALTSGNIIPVNENSMNDAAGQFITKFENLDVEKAVENTEKLVADIQDPVKRGELINSMLDSAVDVVMGLLPKIHIENLEGDSAGFHYSVGNIDLGGFKVRKEKVTLKINFETATAENLLSGFELISFHAWGMSCILEKLNFSFEQQSFPYLNGEGTAMSYANDISLQLGFGVRWYKGTPQLYMSRREVDIAALELEIEDSWFSAMYNVLIAAFSNLIKSYVCDSIEEQIDGHVDLLVQSLDGMLSHDIVKPWLANLAPKNVKEDANKVSVKILKNVKRTVRKKQMVKKKIKTKHTIMENDKEKVIETEEEKEIEEEIEETIEVEEEVSEGEDENEILTIVMADGTVIRRPKNKRLMLSSERQAEARARQKAIDEAQKKLTKQGQDPKSPEHKATLEAIKNRAMAVYDEFRKKNDPNSPTARAKDSQSMEDLGAALAQMSVMRSVLKSLKAGRQVTRGQAQQTVFSAIYAVDDEDVKQCLNEIHGVLVKATVDNTSPQSKSAASKVGGWVKGWVSSVGPTGGPSASAQNEIVSSDERKQLIFGLGLALSSPKFQKPTLRVRAMNRLCAANKKEKNPNTLVKIADLREVTIQWWEFNHKMVEDLHEFKRRESQGVSPPSSSKGLVNVSPQQQGISTTTQQQKISQHSKSSMPSPGSDDGSNNPNHLEDVLASEKFQNVLNNLNICQDAMFRIKKDLIMSIELRDKRQLETILLHLLDAIRCHTDGADMIHELNEIKARRKRAVSGSSPNSPDNAGIPSKSVSSIITQPHNTNATLPSSAPERVSEFLLNG